MANHKLPPLPSGCVILSFSQTTNNRLLIDGHKYRPRSEQIRIANLYIEAGVNVENAKRYLRHILKDQPELTP